MPAGSQFASSWLSQRERVDSQSRSSALVAGLNAWLANRDSVTLADLGCGRGSNVQFLVPRLSVPQRWALFDHDPELLKEARGRAMQLHDARGQPVQVATHCTSLATLAHPALLEADVVSASALIDLVSQPWLDALAAQCAEQRQALLVSLSVTGSGASSMRSTSHSITPKIASYGACSMPTSSVTRGWARRWEATPMRRSWRRSNAGV
ncbi:hypothetical protein HAALTHF_49010n [Vreelandella aquamarina]|nr:hypothetical protein HAALTHF_49010n [Halomonas axialensis]